MAERPKLNYSITGPATTIGWGPSGHPFFVTTTSGGTATTATLHWRGDTILFVTNAAGAVTDFKVALDGDVTPHDVSFTGLSVYDRDPAGVMVETSNATGSTGFNPLDPTTISGARAAGTTGYQAAFVPDQYVRGDGFLVAGVQINGVRAFDPNLGVWTTPDAYEGDVHDPASQQRYMFDRGNAADYSDPSGFDPDNNLRAGFNLQEHTLITPHGATSLTEIHRPYDHTAGAHGAAKGKIIGGTIATAASFAIPGGGKLVDVIVSNVVGVGVTTLGEKVGEAVGDDWAGHSGHDPGPPSAAAERGYSVLTNVTNVKTGLDIAHAVASKAVESGGKALKNVAERALKALDASRL